MLALEVGKSLASFARPLRPLGVTLQLEPITLDEWLKLLLTAAIILAVMEIFKWIWNRRKAD